MHRFGNIFSFYTFQQCPAQLTVSVEEAVHLRVGHVPSVPAMSYIQAL